MPHIDSPAYYRQVARSLDKAFHDLPAPEEVLFGEDIAVAIHLVVTDVGNLLSDIIDELAANSREEATAPATCPPGERAGTVALASCAPPLGIALANLALIVDHLGSAHENARTPVSGGVRRARTPTRSHSWNCSTRWAPTCGRHRGTWRSKEHDCPARPPHRPPRYRPR